EGRGIVHVGLLPIGIREACWQQAEGGKRRSPDGQPFCRIPQGRPEPVPASFQWRQNATGQINAGLNSDPSSENKYSRDGGGFLPVYSAASLRGLTSGSGCIGWLSISSVPA